MFIEYDSGKENIYPAFSLKGCFSLPNVDVGGHNHMFY